MQTLYAKIINIQNCYDTTSFPVTLTINTFDEAVFDENIAICENNPVILEAGNGFTSYTWNTNPVQNSQSITVNTAGIYEVILENNLGCTKTQTFTVNSSEIATIQSITINDFAENNTATIVSIGNGNYEFSLDNTFYQESNVFSNLSPGEYTVYVRNECGLVSQTFYILDYPKFFTPNSDGYNDTWQIANLDKRDLQDSKIYLFDRYGKLLKQINPLGEGWNGTYNGELLPSEDYWFVLELSNGKELKITSHLNDN
ncbi:MAG: T9SS type B sorting domain-containing protein [Flavobacterium sp.]|nr:T9SS type B sorting domain-containing protein [Flavobacterium sp.]